MGSWTIVAFLAIVFVGSYVQAVAGFAMGMIIVALVGGLRLLDIPTLAATISLLTILNVYLALRGQLHHVHRHLFGWIAAGQVPAIFLGFQLVYFLDGNVRWLLELVLGLFITAGGLSMMIKPKPWPQVTGRLRAWSTGVLGGIVGGMFSASGPVLGWFGYNQPLPLAVIRSTLLACFALTTMTRTVFVAANGELTPQVLSLVAAGLPVVVVGTLLGRHLPPAASEETIKRMSYGLLLATGVWILASAAYNA